MDYNVKPIENLKHLSPEEAIEAQKVIDLSLHAMRHTDANDIGDSILAAVNLGGEIKNKELAMEREQLAARSKQLVSIAENITRDLAAETQANNVCNHFPDFLSVNFRTFLVNHNKL
jgi:hypothetical protein